MYNRKLAYQRSTIAFSHQRKSDPIRFGLPYSAFVEYTRRSLKVIKHPSARSQNEIKHLKG